MFEVVRNARSGEVALALGVSPASVQAYARAGKIPFSLTPGRQYRFNVDEVLELLGPRRLSESSDLVDVFSADRGVVIDPLSGYRSNLVDEAALSVLRSRGVRGRTPNPARVGICASDGVRELDGLVRRSGGAAIAVLHNA